MLLEAIDIHADGLKRAALAAGPSAPVPNCPKWTVHDLVTHVASVHCAAIGTAIGRPVTPAPPGGWDDLLGWWDGQRLALREAVARTPGLVRRIAHETAIHRLDAESALEPPPRTRFSPAFAVDGIDEFLTVLAADRRIGVTTPDRTWPAAAPEVELSGAAYDVYRALYGRPNAASVTGDPARLPAP